MADDLVYFLELPMFINASLPFYYLIRRTGDSDMKKKLLDTIYIIFFLVIVTDDLN